jgi:hypothetical protein
VNERRPEGGEGEGSGWRKESECYARPHWGVQNLSTTSLNRNLFRDFVLLSTCEVTSNENSDSLVVKLSRLVLLCNNAEIHCSDCKDDSRAHTILSWTKTNTQSK